MRAQRAASLGLVLILIGTALSACARKDGGAPVYYRDSQSYDVTVPPAPGYRPEPVTYSAPTNTDSVELAGPYTVLVEKGDNVYQIAQANNLLVRDLIEANSLQPPYAIQAGQELVIPASRLHKVARGETLYAIARQYDLKPWEMVSANELDQPYVIKPGQVLRVPGKHMSGQANIAARSEREVRVASADPITSYQSAASAPKTLTPRQKPTGSIPAAPAPAARSTAPIKKSALSSGVPTPPAPKAAGSALKRSDFIMPVSGRVVSGFGPKEDGYHNDGVNIAARKGEPIKAAKGGIVTYAGNELKGYGNLILVKHDNGYVTAYAHTDKMMVRRGDIVEQGQVIARVGETGAVDSPQLHFEIRRGRDAVNPSGYLSGV